MFYQFSQNNSGGYFKAPALIVYIEADSEEEANDRVQEYGVYFNGCESGNDCSCCGDRWYATWYDAVEAPKQDLVKEERESYLSSKRLWAKSDAVPLCLIVYKDGTTETLLHDWKEEEVK